MKKIILFFVIIISFVSCEVPFDPKGELEDRYVLNCILRSDTTLQIATLTKNYQIDGFDASSHTEDPSISNADIKVWLGDSVYSFKDTTVFANDPRYDSSLSLYYHKNIKVEYNKLYEIEALTPEGRRLKAETISPTPLNFDDNSEDIIPPVSKNFVEVLWSSNNKGVFYLPQMKVTYFKTEGSSSEKFIKRIPLKYIEDKSIFAEPSSNINYVVDVSVISQALKEISLNDPNKQSYSVDLSVEVEVLVFDKNLTKYFSSTSKSFDDLTVRLDENDYSNISGGFGVFGSYVSSEYKLKFQANYISTFGYKPLF